MTQRFMVASASLFVLFSVLLGSPVRAAAQNPAPVLECTESCRRFANDSSCAYRSSCRFEGNCVTARTCASFDFFGGCGDERETKTCAVPVCPGYPVPAPQFPITCETRCQKRDSYGQCLYTTACEINGRCMKLTDCEKFDSFGEKCLSERVVQSCF
jgi:hypothetical protein